MRSTEDMYAAYLSVSDRHHNDTETWLELQERRNTLYCNLLPMLNVVKLPSGWYQSRDGRFLHDGLSGYVQAVGVGNVYLPCPDPTLAAADVQEMRDFATHCRMYRGIMDYRTECAEELAIQRRMASYTPVPYITERYDRAGNLYSTIEYA